ncbi:MAG: Kazal-type serine protease inhibitor domain-containing protein [Bacteroidota bacterium]|jgi:hypothetical protein
MQLKYKAFVIILIIFYFPNLTNAQIVTCKDPNNLNPQFPCPDPSYKPVCGCDGVTYRNICSAEIQNGILPGQWRDGTCSGLEFDIIPTITNAYLTFTFVQPINTTTIAQMVIIDQYGAMVYYRTLYPDLSGRVEMQISETEHYRPGVYIMLVYNEKGDYRFKKFIKY